MFLLDTNVVSELMRATPEPRVLEWLQSQPSEQLYTSVLTVAEILAGVLILPPGQRRMRLDVAARAAP